MEKVPKVNIRKALGAVWCSARMALSVRRSGKTVQNISTWKSHSIELHTLHGTSNTRSFDKVLYKKTKSECLLWLDISISENGDEVKNLQPKTLLTHCDQAKHFADCRRSVKLPTWTLIRCKRPEYPTRHLQESFSIPCLSKAQGKFLWKEIRRLLPVLRHERLFN
jgi:hypothetical protein